MTERQSAWSAVMMANWIAEAQCPKCPEVNVKGKKHLIELDPHGVVYCNACGFSYQAPRPEHKVVH